jgi:hypothetical protein
MRRYISVTDPNFKRKDGSKYIRDRLPVDTSKAPPHLFNKEPVVVYSGNGRKRKGKVVEK